MYIFKKCSPPSPNISKFLNLHSYEDHISLMSKLFWKLSLMLNIETFYKFLKQNLKSNFCYIKKLKISYNFFRIVSERSPCSQNFSRKSATIEGGGGRRVCRSLSWTGHRNFHSKKRAIGLKTSDVSMMSRKEAEWWHE